MNTGVPPAEFVVVVVPAHNEEDGIEECVAGLRRAAAHPRLSAVSVHLVVVLDDCDDATGTRAVAALAPPAPSGRALSASIVPVSFCNVGAARAFGAAHAFRLLGCADDLQRQSGSANDLLPRPGCANDLQCPSGSVDPATVWLATTDADSVVPSDWLAHHLELREQGADGCAGMVVVDSWREHTVSTQETYERRYWPQGRLDHEHAHVHGTNLGVSMAAYLDAGGFPQVVTGEDHALWRALVAAGRRLVATPIAPVTTSGRRHGRSPAGFADLLTSLDSLPA